MTWNDRQNRRNESEDQNDKAMMATTNYDVRQ